MIGVHIAEKGAPRLGFVEDTSIVKIYRHIAFFRYIAMEVQRCLKNGQLLLYSGRAKLTFKCREFAATPSRKR